MRITDLTSFAPKNIDLSSELSELTDETSEVLKSKEQLTYSEDKLEVLKTDSLATYVALGILNDSAGTNAITKDEVTIDFLSETINQALAQPEFQQNSLPAQMDTKVPELKLPTESEKETRRLFDGAKDSLLKQIPFADSESFDAYLRKIYGDNYDKEAGERIRQKMLAGDESWLPKVEYVSSESLQGHEFAVDPSSKKMYFYRESFFKAVPPEPTDVPNEGPSKESPQFPTWMTGSPEDNAYAFYEVGLWNGLRNELDPQDASNVEGRNFGTMYFDGKPTIVEWPQGPKGPWGSNDPPRIS